MVGGVEAPGAGGLSCVGRALGSFCLELGRMLSDVLGAGHNSATRHDAHCNMLCNIAPGVYTWDIAHVRGSTVLIYISLSD